MGLQLLLTTMIALMCLNYSKAKCLHHCGILQDEFWCEFETPPTVASNCTCPNGYFLSAELNTCIPNKFKNFILFIASGSIYHHYLTSNATIKLPITVSDNPQFIDYDPVEKRIFWSEQHTNGIRSAFLNGSDQKVSFALSADFQPYGITIDSKSRLIFYTDRSNHNIGVFSMTSLNHKHLICTGIEAPLDIVLHTNEGIMFWLDESKIVKLERATYTGQNRREVVTFDVSPVQLTLDAEKNLLYWSTVYGDLERCDLEGRRCEVVHTTGERFEVTYVLGLVFDANTIYTLEKTFYEMATKRRNKENNLTEIIGVDLAKSCVVKFNASVLKIDDKFCVDAAILGLHIHSTTKKTGQNWSCSVFYDCNKTFDVSSKCDERFDCSQETEAQQCSMTCSGSYLHTCDDGRCFHFEDQCNSRKECIDRTDETGCGTDVLLRKEGDTVIFLWELIVREASIQFSKGHNVFYAPVFSYENKNDREKYLTTGSRKRLYLIVRNLTDDDSGMYKCQAVRNGRVVGMCNNKSLIIVGIPRPPLEDSDMRGIHRCAYNGMNVSLSVMADPVPNISSIWVVDTSGEIKLLTSNFVIHTFRNATHPLITKFILEIHIPSGDLCGRIYYVNVTNRKGTATLNFTLEKDIGGNNMQRVDMLLTSAVVAGCLAFTAVTFVIFICYRKGSRMYARTNNKGSKGREPYLTLRKLQRHDTEESDEGSNCYDEICEIPEVNQEDGNNYLYAIPTPDDTITPVSDETLPESSPVSSTVNQEEGSNYLYAIPTPNDTITPVSDETLPESRPVSSTVNQEEGSNYLYAILTPNDTITPVSDETLPESSPVSSTVNQEEGSNYLYAILTPNDTITPVSDETLPESSPEHQQDDYLHPSNDSHCEQVLDEFEQNDYLHPSNDSYCEQVLDEFEQSDCL